MAPKEFDRPHRPLLIPATQPRVVTRDKAWFAQQGKKYMAHAQQLIAWRTGKNCSIGYVKAHSGPSRPLYYVQRDAMDWILDRKCVRIARGSTMDELQQIAEREQ